MRALCLCAVAFAWLGLTAVTASAGGPTILNFDGFLYEEDNTPGWTGYPPSNPGDVLAGCGIITGMSSPLTWSTSEYQYTWTVQGLVSLGQIDWGGDLIEIDYTGGTIDIVADRYAGAAYTAPEYGVEPPNVTAPANFHDGSVYLHGHFTSFVMFWFPSLHTGQYEGMVTFSLGSNLGDLVDPGGYVFAGTTDRAAAIVTPLGYDFEAVGHIDFDSSVPTQKSTWGGVKNLYR